MLFLADLSVYESEAGDRAARHPEAIQHKRSDLYRIQRKEMFSYV